MIHLIPRIAIPGFTAAVAADPGASLATQNLSYPFEITIRELRAQWQCLRTWRGYRPERHYMRGAQTVVARPARQQSNH
jgi:hypothetical protein